MLSESPFPDPRTAAGDMPLAQGGDLSPELLLHAYSRGIFPWFSGDEPILWWSPDPRCVLLPQNLKVRPSLQKRMRQKAWSLSVNKDFAGVIAACAQVPRPGQDGTWITPQIEEAYCRLHALGYAHSIEVYCEGELAGGLYGLALGTVFFGESMFHYQPDASKIALAGLVEVLVQRGFTLIDCQQATSHLLSMGAEVWPRTRFLDVLAQCVAGSLPEDGDHLPDARTNTSDAGGGLADASALPEDTSVSHASTNTLGGGLADVAVSLPPEGTSLPDVADRANEPNNL